MIYLVILSSLDIWVINPKLFFFYCVELLEEEEKKTTSGWRDGAAGKVAAITHEDCIWIPRDHVEPAVAYNLGTPVARWKEE